MAVIYAVNAVHSMFTIYLRALTVYLLDSIEIKHKLIKFRLFCLIKVNSLTTQGTCKEQMYFFYLITILFHCTVYVLPLLGITFICGVNVPN